MSIATPPDFLENLEISIPSTQVGNDDISTIDSDHVNVTGNNKIQQCIVTCFPPDTDPKWLLPETYFKDTTIIQNWCGQFEKAGTTDALHFHVYVQFVNSKKPRFNALRKIFVDTLNNSSTVNIRKSKHRMSSKSQDCSANYVLAPSKRAPDTEAFIWPHNKRKLEFKQDLWDSKKSKPSKEDRDKEIVDYIESKPKHWTWEQIVHENVDSKYLLASCAWGSKFHAGRHAETARRTIANVIILYGAGGTGKTTIAQSWSADEMPVIEERYYKRNYDDGKFWGGGRTAYKCQPIVHLEEFCGQETASKFKEICDIGKVGPTVNIKNGGIMLNHETVLITSNHHPAAWFRSMCQKDPKQWNPICRRFTQVWFFPEEREDGSPNRPSEGNPPYYIDQTDDFKSFMDNYSDACEHASKYWAIPDSTGQSDTFYDPSAVPRTNRTEFHEYCQTGRIKTRE
jgi:hypothetical protein